MASIVIGAAASAATGNFGAFAASALGDFLGRSAGNLLFGGSAKAVGPRLSDLSVQTSTYGRAIPAVYGTARIAGNIIWARPLKETAVTSSSGGGKGGGGAKQSQTSFHYSATLAIAICEGEITDVLRVWADAKPVDPLDYPNGWTLYKGSEDQLPDPVIESFEGAGNAPAYRGLAYAVIEDFPLGDFGNRIPNFTFEVKRKLLPSDSGNESVENMITGMIMIPGSGEFVYDTLVQSKAAGEQAGEAFIENGARTRINQHNRHNKADALVALDQLLETCPNLEWVGLVVTWFGDSLDAGDCVILPGVEYQEGAATSPDVWQAGSFSRATARQITLDGQGNPVYGGTPSDACVLRYIAELKARGLKVMFYPMFFMDVTDKPWRGRVTGTATEVSDFFTKTNGYNAFITHYANLVGAQVDAFVIGSELIGLTKVKDGSNNFPAVDRLVALAATVKGIVGSGVKVTYAADWSEYHHTDGGWYNLDPLWASPNIDMVGIDAYFPLTDAPQSGYDLQAALGGWTSGEGYDWIYTDPERTVQENISSPYAWKNIQWWWISQHVNPGGATTAWVPQSKKIWFTEYGFPSVDGATNQPNVFYDPNSSESFFPYHSKGRVDLRAQRLGLTATEVKWLDSAMIERKFAWTWDARPFPYWPDLRSVWADGDLWATGHWMNGKLGLSGLAAIVAGLCRKSGLNDADFDAARLTDLVDGYVLLEQQSARAAIEDLRRAYFFDAVESDGVLRFIPRGGEPAAAIAEEELVPERRGEKRDLLTVTRAPELELPQKVDITYLSRTRDYLIGNQHAQRLATPSIEQKTVNLPLVFTDQDAKRTADITLFNAWQERTSFEFRLPWSYAALDPADVITVTADGITHTVRITGTQGGAPGIIRVRGVAEDVSVYDFYNAPGAAESPTSLVIPPGETSLRLLDLPALPGDAGDQGALRLAVSGLEEGWKGAVIYRSGDGGVNYAQIAALDEASITGSALDALGAAPAQLFDEGNAVTVLLRGGELVGVSELAVLNGTNTALLGGEIIQFKTATLLEPGKYRLSGLLRGRAGTEWAIADHAAGEEFTLLDARIARQNVPVGLFGLARLYKPVSVGSTLGAAAAQSFTYRGNTLKPWAPVHISGARDGSGDLTISWVRRTRSGGDWRDGVDIPLSEVTEAYEVEIMDGDDVVRTITGLTSPQASYTAAQQTEDFGAPQSSVSVRVYQLSAIVGRGTAGEGVV